MSAPTRRIPIRLMPIAARPMPARLSAASPICCRSWSRTMSTGRFLPSSSSLPAHLGPGPTSIRPLTTAIPTCPIHRGLRALVTSSQRPITRSNRFCARRTTPARGTTVWLLGSLTPMASTFGTPSTAESSLLTTFMTCPSMAENWGAATTSAWAAVLARLTRTIGGLPNGRPLSASTTPIQRRGSPTSRMGRPTRSLSWRL